MENAVSVLDLRRHFLERQSCHGGLSSSVFVLLAAFGERVVHTLKSVFRQMYINLM